MVTYKEAYELPIGQHVEKKGKFSYLSWVFAVRFMREHFPESSWTVHENSNGTPIFTVGMSHFVKVTVHHEGHDFCQWHPILNGANKPIQEPTSFEINTSIQRALTKAIGIATGIGLALYAGEDLPKDEPDEEFAEQTKAMDQIVNWIDKLFDDKAVDKQGNPITSNFLLNWFETTKAVVEAKKKLTPENLAKVESYLNQVVNAMIEREQKAA